MRPSDLEGKNTTFVTTFGGTQDYSKEIIGNSLAKKNMAENNISPLKEFNRFLVNPKTQDYLATVLAEKKASFVNNITALVSNNAALQVCKPDSLIFASLKATALDLPLDQNLGFAYVLPYKDNKNGVTVAQFQMGYKGFIQLAIRTGQFKTINATDVRQGELVDENFITGELTFKKAENREKLPIIGYVAYFKLITGFEKYLYMSRAEMDDHAKKYSQTYRKGYGLWADKDMFNSMAIKTVIKLLLSKYAPLSVEMKEAITVDQAAILEDGRQSYVDRPDDQVQPETIEEAVGQKKDALRARKNEAEQAPQDGSIFPSKPEDLP